MRLSTLARALGLVVLIAAAGTAAADPTELRIGTEGAYPPFEYRDPSGQLKGFEIDVGNALCAEMKVKCTFLPQDFDGLIPALKAGKIDMIMSSLSVTPERAKVIDFSKPYYVSPSQYVAATNSGITDDPKTLQGKTVAVQSGTIHQAFLEQNRPDITEKAYNTIEEAELDLEAGRVDAFLADKLILYDWLVKAGRAKGFDYVGKPVVGPLVTGQIAVGIRKGDTALKARLDAAIDQLLASPDYDKLSGAYFPFSIRP
jgi:putative lysine/arginine/ornithine/histidine/octopine transport system substrate-binding protein